MPDLKITVSQPLLEALQPFVVAYNAENAETLSLEQWVELHLREVAIGPRLAQTIQRLQRESEATLATQQIEERQSALRDLAILAP